MSICLLSGCFDVVSSMPLLLWPELEFQSPEPKNLQIGASAVKITPTHNVFLAGGIPYRLALGVHDDIWARAIAIDDGTYRIALVAMDLIGINYDDVVRIRQEIAEKIDIDHCMIATTHTHSAPDIIGIWAPFPSCADSRYRVYLGRQVVQAVTQAFENLRPAYIRIATGNSGDPPLSRDTRPPIHIDDTLTVWQAIDNQTGQTIATAVHYASHPILVPSLSFDISSDFVHYLRNALESGMQGDNGPVNALGGVCVFFNGALGGRITPANTDPLTTVPPIDSRYQPVRAYGYRLAYRVQQLLDNLTGTLETFDQPMTLSVATSKITVPLVNPILSYAAEHCIVARTVTDGQVNSEVGIVRIGPIELFATPGMIFPELVTGGIAPLPGSDFPDAPAESPVIAQQASQPYPVVVMANDMLGYLIPKALYDAEPPFTTGSRPYGEQLCTGPEAAAIVIDAFAELQGLSAQEADQ